MPELQDYIITDLNKVPDKLGTRLYCLHSGVFEGAPYLDCAWFSPQQEERVVVDKGHVHDYPEVITFFGSDPDDPADLCGVVELWLDGKPQTLTKSCIIFVPSGMEHCPLIIKRADRPIFHFATSNDPNYKGPHEE
ncbi:MAG: hypothetical protein SVV67_00175 [Bacillota bacterium]|nr:hypothetical protein [Bacillota bacterium]